MVKQILVVLLVAAVVFGLGSRNVAADKSFIVKALKVSIESADNTAETTIDPTGNGEFFPITDGMLPFRLEIVGEEKGREKILTSYCLQVVDRPGGERLLFCSELEKGAGFSYFEVSIPPVVHFLLGGFKYAEAKILGETIKISFFRPEDSEDTRENKPDGKRISFAGL